MLTLKTFAFNPYQENTYVLADAQGQCAVIDPGCYFPHERETLTNYLQEQGLTLEKVLLTHGHIDHMVGNATLLRQFDVPLVAHRKCMADLQAAPQLGSMMGLNVDPSPEPTVWIEAGDTVSVGQLQLDVLYTPGHAEGHVSFFHRPTEQLFAGDVLFQGSIGRTDFPGGSMDVLMASIFEQVLPLGDTVKVYPGHGPATTVGAERRGNPFLLNYRR
jgi:glyoxylase-like metal-dependent hydrolase (beta-lactamase superfamily II)